MPNRVGSDNSPTNAVDAKRRPSYKDVVSMTLNISIIDEARGHNDNQSV